MDVFLTIFALTFERKDFSLELSFLNRFCRLNVRLETEFIQLLLGEFVFLGEKFCTSELAELNAFAPILLNPSGLLGASMACFQAIHDTRTNWNFRHRFYTHSNDHIIRSAH